MTYTKTHFNAMLLITFLLLAKIKHADYVTNHPFVQSVGMAILHASLIFLFYLVGKFVIEDGKHRTKAVFFWFITDKFVLTLAVLHLVLHEHPDIHLWTSDFWILLFFLVDPVNIIGKTIGESNTIVSGYFLRDVLSDRRNSLIDYLFIAAILIGMYIMILRH